MERRPVLRLYTYGELRQKVEEDQDLQDEALVSPDGMAGLFNDAIDEAEAEIHKLGLEEDYFLKRAWLPLVQGEDEIELPSDIYAQKIRKLWYRNGSTSYPITRFRGSKKFEEIDEWSDSVNSSAEYRHSLLSQNTGEQATLLLVPASRETAAQVVRIWYIRNAQRVPLLNEIVEWDTLGTVDAGADTLEINRPLSTGDLVKLSGSDLPEPLVAGTSYYAIAVDDETVKLATSRALALAGTAIDLTDAGSGTMTLSVKITQELQDQVALDIPEFTSFLVRHVKLACVDKETDPRYAEYLAERERQRKLMIDTLTERVPDDDNRVEMDLSHYEEMS